MPIKGCKFIIEGRIDCHELRERGWTVNYQFVVDSCQLPVARKTKTVCAQTALGCGFAKGEQIAVGVKDGEVFHAVVFFLEVAVGVQNALRF